MGQVLYKLADGIGSGTPDPSTAPARQAPVPQTAIENKPAPGQRGPVGLGGRTTYSRVNTGTPPTPDMGASAQKSQAPRGLEFLPKVASVQENSSMPTMTGRPSLQELIKQATAGAAARVDVGLEAARQIANNGGTPPVTQTKTASARPTSMPTTLTIKLAGALDSIAKKMNPKLAAIELDSGTTTGVGPGEGPGALDVTHAVSSNPPLQPNESGRALEQPPKNPEQQKDPTRPADPGTGLQTNDAVEHPEQPEEPIPNQKTSIEGQKTSAAYANNLVTLGLARIETDGKGNLQLVKTGGVGKIAAAKDETPLERKGRSVGGTVGKVTGAIAGSTAGHQRAKALGGGRVARGIGTIGGGLTRMGVGKHVPKGAKHASAIEQAAAAMAKTARLPLATFMNPVGYGLGRMQTGDAAGGHQAAEEGLRGNLLGSLAGLGVGGGVGALGGAGLGALYGSAGEGALIGGGIGAGLGTGIGAGYGMVSGHQKAVNDFLANKALEAQAAEGAPKTGSVYARNLMAVGLYKQAEDAIFPAQIDAGKINDTIGPNLPDGVSASETDGPPEPSDVNSQKNLIASNEAAINYKKQQAKADPKHDLGAIINEPALSMQHDRTLREAFDHTEEAGTKFASVNASLTKTAAARAVLAKLAEQQKTAGEPPKSKKTKKAMMGGGSAPNTPQAASGFNASQPM